jgi:hypothetical protein
VEQKLKLQDIAEWQFAEDSEVTLPKMQRGFVWHPEQIEALWDSLLRRYPIGSFLFSKTKEEKYLLMDGQQRATAIALGFFNPFADKMSPWSIKENSDHLPVVWIDINPPQKKLPERSKFLIRVVTRSHPWGYSVNHEKLGINDRKSALELFKLNPKNKDMGYTQFANTTYYPFDAWYPVPLAFFINAIKDGNVSKESVSQAVIEMCEKKLPEYFHTQQNKFKNREQFIKKLEDDFQEHLNNISQKVLSAIKSTTINYDTLDEAVLNEEDNVGAEQEYQGISSDSEAENPTLFVRINSGGTTLGGDDLIYSIYKATFPKSKELVEEIGMDYIPPTQIISIASRIAYSKGKYPRRMSVQVFQTNIKKKMFQKNMNVLIGSPEDEGPLKKHFQSAVDLLSLKDVEGFNGEYSEMPPVLVKEFIKKSQDLFLFLIYWLYKNDKKEITADSKRKIVARLLIFSWFTYDRSKKTIEKTVKEIWKQGNNPDFWAQPINNLFESKEQLFAIPVSPDLLKKYYFSKTVENRFFDNKDDQWELIKCNEGEAIRRFYEKEKVHMKPFSKKEWQENAEDNFQHFVTNLTGGWSLILFAQKEYINEQFKDFNQLDDLDDTNTPWDWDHIYPNSWVYNQKKLPQIVRSWNECAGNYRVLALEQNRSENNNLSPADRLSNLPDNDPPLTGEQIRELSFVNDKSKYADDWKYWKDITDMLRGDWDKKDILKHYRAVVTRMLNIYKRWWDDLQIWDVLGLKNK